jgi:DNA repair exonuclease SbcCD ATPase subunit
LGEILFAAASGVSQLGRILRRLEDEASQFFNPRTNATKASINRCLSELSKKLKEVRDLQIPTGDWEAQLQALEHDREKLRQVQKDLGRIEGERENLQRLRRVLPLLVRRETLRVQQARLAEVPLLAESFSDRRFELQRDQSTAHIRRNELDDALLALERKLGELLLPEDLLQRAPRIQELNQELGSYLKAQHDRHRLEQAPKMEEARCAVRQSPRPR